MVYGHVTPEFLRELRNIAGEKYVWEDIDKLIPYEKDEGVEKSLFRRPDAVVLPETTEQVSVIMKLANTYKIPVTPRGAGTGLELAAVVGPMGGIILDTARMNRILEMNVEKKYMVVEPGVITADIQKEAQKAGLLYAGDPCSGDCCCIGGNAATNAGGNRAVKYGTTRDQIYAIEVVMPSGEIARFGGRLKKSSTGYPMEEIIIGSEGTLGIITQLTLRLVPLPKYTVDILAVFPTLTQALSLITALPGAGIEETCLECMDNDVVRVVEQYLDEKQPYSDIGNYMIIQIDGMSEEEMDEKCIVVDEVCRAHGALEVFVADADKVWKVRKAFTEASAAECPVAAMEDFVVPPDELECLMEKLAVIGKEQGIRFRGVSHAGDGNLHLDVLRRGFTAEEEADKIAAFENAVCAAVYELGGRISGEHGIGQTRKALFEKYTDAGALAVMKAVKKALDPNLILNPGKIFDLD